MSEAVEQAAIEAGHIDTSSVDEFDDSALGNEPVETSPDDTPAPEEKAKPEAKEEKPKAETTKKAESEEKDYLLPKSRYDYQASKRREAEERANDLETRNEELQARIQEIEQHQANLAQAEQKVQSDEIAALEAQVVKLDEEAEELRSDGDRKGAAAKQRQVRQIEREIERLESEPVEMPDAGQIRASALSQMREEVALEKVIDEVETNYSVLKEGNDDYDKDLVDEVMNLYDAMLAGGERPATAMERAVGYVVGPPPKANGKGGGRKKEAVQRNLRAAASQPADLEGVGYDSDRGGPSKPVDIMHMSIEEYESLGIDEDKFLS